MLAAKYRSAMPAEQAFCLDRQAVNEVGNSHKSRVRADASAYEQNSGGSPIKSTVI